MFFQSKSARRIFTVRGCIHDVRAALNMPKSATSLGLDVIRAIATSQHVEVVVIIVALEARRNYVRGLVVSVEHPVVCDYLQNT